MNTLVTCPICNIKLKEINTAHLKKHSLNVQEFDKLYTNYERLSYDSREKKATLKNLSEETSKRLKISHTIEGYKKKYGEEIGNIKYKEMKLRKSFGHTINFYIDKYGEEGKNIFYKISNLKAIHLENFIKKYGDEEGRDRYLNWKNSGKIESFIKKFGEKEGITKWIEKNEKVSKKNRKIPIECLDDFNRYRNIVYKITKLSLSLFSIENIELRGLKNDHDLDHRVSMYYGFINNVDPIVIGSTYNLKVITSHENRTKRANCSCSISEIIDLVNNDNKYKKIREYYKKWKKFVYKNFEMC